MSDDQQRYIKELYDDPMLAGISAYTRLKARRKDVLMGRFIVCPGSFATIQPGSRFTGRGVHVVEIVKKKRFRSYCDKCGFFFGTWGNLFSDSSDLCFSATVDEGQAKILVQELHYFRIMLQAIHGIPFHGATVTGVEVLTIKGWVDRLWQALMENPALRAQYLALIPPDQEPTLDTTPAPSTLTSMTMTPKTKTRGTELIPSDSSPSENT